MNSNPYDAPISSNVGDSETPRRVADVHTTTSQFKATIVAVGVWQVACLAMMYVYGYLAIHVVVAVYTLLYGDIQASYGRFERLTTYFGLLLITLPACILTIAIVEKLSSRKGTAKRRTVTVVCWELLTMVVLASSYEFGFPYMINQLDWNIFGPPTEIYSFHNLNLHRIIAWLLCTMPIACFAVWIYSRSCDSRPSG